DVCSSDLGHDGIGTVFQPETEEGLVTRAEVADLAADRQEAIAACLRNFEFHQVFLLVVDIPAHGAAGALLEQRRQLKEKRGRRLVRRVWPGVLAPSDVAVKGGLRLFDQAAVAPDGAGGILEMGDGAAAVAGG